MNIKVTYGENLYLHRYHIYIKGYIENSNITNTKDVLKI